MTDTILYPVADLAERSVRDRRDFEKDSDSQISLFKFGLVDENTDDVGGILGELPEETRIVIPDKTAIEIPVIKEPPASKGKDEKSSREESVTEKQVTEEQTTEESNKDKSTIEKQTKKNQPKKNRPKRNQPKKNQSQKNRLQSDITTSIPKITIYTMAVRKKNAETISRRFAC